MKKKKLDNKKSNKFLYVIIAAGLLAFVLDHFVIVNIEVVTKVATHVQSIVTVIAGIWITCYLLFLELFRDRYPLEHLNKDLLPRMRNNFILILYDVIYGCVLIVFNYSFWGSLWFLTASIMTLIIIFVDVYNANKTLMISEYVKKFFCEVSKSFNSHEGIIDSSFLEEIKQILNESIAKEEFYTAQTIIEQTGICFRDYLGNLVKLSDKIGSDKVEKSFEEVVYFNIKELELCENVPSDLLKRELLNEQETNLLYCIDNKQYEWFKIYFHELSRFVFKIQKDGNAELAEDLYGIYYRLTKKLIKLDKQEWVNYAIEEIESLTFAYIYVFNKNYIRNYVMLLTELLEFCIKKKHDHYYEVFFKCLEKFADMKYIEHGAFDEVKALFSSLFFCC